ncbi:MAG: hypothetical protein ISS34_04405 [Candidatus Omnitrophica bacterium]|nr:hypothetical protein [Candidatus Omnitrophota bacterium]
MKYGEFIKLVRDLPLIEVGLILAGVPNPDPVKVQISRWVKAHKLIQLRRGVYLLPKAFRKIDVYEPYLAAVLKKPSYISIEKALEYHDIIPEAVKIFTSVTTKRGRRFTTKLGVFNYQHIKNSLFWGYEAVTINKQTAFFATPEKALLDLLYLKRIKTTTAYLDELRLQNLERLNLRRLLEYGRRFKKPGMRRAARLIKKYAEYQKKGRRVA